MLDVKLNDTSARLWLGRMPEKMHASLEHAVYLLAEKLRSHVVTDKLLGQVLKRRSGRLGQSIQQRVTSTPNSVTGKVYSSSDVPYNAIHEYGGKTAAHVIEARRGKALSFTMGGMQVFAKKVNHPGSTVPERSYMRSSLRDMSTEIVMRMRGAVAEGIKP